MIRRLPTDVPVRKPDSDDELLRIVASAANEAVDALGLPIPKAAAALNEVVVRYTRTLRLTPRILHDAISDARTALRSDGAATSAARADADHDEGEGGKGVGEQVAGSDPAGAAPSDSVAPSDPA
jgi:non-specific serine/threonine protein kinase